VCLLFTGGGNPAYKLPNHLPQDIMDARRDALMAVQQPISLNKKSSRSGQSSRCPEQENPETGELIGRSARFSPEVDGLVYVQKANWGRWCQS